MYTAVTMTATNTTSATIRSGASSVPAVTEASAGGTMSAVVTRSRRMSGSFTARLPIIDSTPAIRTAVTGSPVSARTPDITSTARIIDAAAMPPSRRRTRPGSTPVRVVRSSAHLARHTTGGVCHLSSAGRLPRPG